MSEQNHSTENSVVEPALPVQPKGTPWMKYIAGTITLVVIAGIGFQFFTANPAASQVEGNNSNAGKATLGGSGKILAKVNNQAISYDVVAAQCVALHGEEVLDNLINRLIIQQECDRQGVTISRSEVEQEVVDTAEKFNLPIDTWYQMLQTERGLNRQQYHDDIIWPMLALKKLAGQNIQVTEAEMTEGFERDYGPRVKARMILVEGNVRQATPIWEQCRANPDDFERIAREHSADPNSRPLGGSIPPIRKHGGNAKIEAEAFKLQNGEISGLIEVAENSYVILKSEGLTDPVVEDIRVVWNDLLEQLTEEKSQRAVAETFERIQKEAKVDNFLTRTTTAGRNPIRQTAAFTAPGNANAPTKSVR